MVQLGSIAEERGVVGLDGPDGLGPQGGDGDDASRLVVGVGADLVLQPGLQDRRLFGWKGLE